MEEYVYNTTINVDDLIDWRYSITDKSIEIIEFV